MIDFLFILLSIYFFLLNLSSTIIFSKTAIVTPFISASLLFLMFCICVSGRSGNEDTAHTKKGPIKFHKSTEEIDNRMTNNNINVNNQDSLPNPHNELPQNPDDAAKLSKKDRLKEKRKRLRKKKKAVENGGKAVLTNSTMESVELTGTLHEGGGEPQDSEQLPNGKNKKKKIKKKKKMVEDAATTAE